MAGKHKHLNGSSHSSAKRHKSSFNGNTVVISDDESSPSEHTQQYSYDTSLDSELDNDLQVTSVLLAEQASPSKLQSVKSIQQDARHIAEVLQLQNVEAVYDKLLKARTDPDRVNTVLNSILENGLDQADVDESKEEKIDIFAEITKVEDLVKKEAPGLKYDLNEIYALLESSAAKIDRVQQVAKVVVGRVPKETTLSADAPNKPSAEKVEEPSSEIPKMVAANDDVVAILLRDTNSLGRIFPNVNKREIYAHLEAHHDKINRVEIVTNDLIKHDQSDEAPSLDTVITSKRSNEPLIDAEILRDVAILQGLFPDCDPNYLYEEMLGRRSGGDVSAVNSLSAQMFELKNYPKLRDRVELQKKAARKHELQNLKFDIDEFLEMFPNPKDFFSDENRTLTPSYILHATSMLLNTFPMLKKGYVKKVMDSHKSHFLPSLREMEKVASAYNAARYKYASHKRFRATLRVAEAMPDECDEMFYRELMFSKREVEILGLLQLRKDQRSRRLASAKENNELFECGCCYDDELLPEDMLSCPEGHLFCSECIRRSSEEILGLAKLDFPCLQAGCGSPFTLSTLQKALKPKTFDLLLRKIQETEIEQAGLDDLVKCPFCTFATIMPNPEDKVLYCKNPDCLRESCRLCQEPNHIPLRCEEVEKQGETDMRTFIEMRVSEAMLRTCWSCKKRFYKTEGCNKMTCSCGASMCYVCRKPVNDYEHFGGRKGQCPQSSNEAQLHQQEMEKALIEAKAKYQMEHPEAAGLKLKYDPELIIAKSDSQPKDFLFNPHHYENSDSSTDSDEDGYY